MMQNLAQAYSPHPGGIQQHPGVPQGHPMAGVQHNPGQPGPGMPQGMHMGVSGPGGPQVSQPGALMGGIPPGAGGPSAHALQHLNPGQAQQAQQLYQQQQAMAFANNPQLAQQMQQQQHMIQQQRQQQAARQALMAQQYSGQMQGMPNGMPMNPVQFAAMRAGPMARPVNLPQHLQQAQQQAQHSLEQQQAQQQAHHQQQQLMAQQMAMQQQQQQNSQQGGNNPGQGQMNRQQLQNMQHAQIAAAQQHQQQQAAQAQAAAQQNQTQNQPQAQPQPPQQTTPAQTPQQPQAPQPQQQQQQQQASLQQQQAAQQAAAMLQQRQGEKLKGQCLMKLMQFADHLSNFPGAKQKDDVSYWVAFVNKFFSPKGVYRHSIWMELDSSNKQYEITFPALARYFHTHFESGIKNMQMIVERGTEKELPNNTHFIESQKSSFIYWFDNGSQLVANGTLRALFDAEHKLELLEFVTNSQEEYLPRARIINAARPLHEWQKEWHKANASPDGKSSPEMSKKGKPKPMKSPPQPPPEIDLPVSKVKPSTGITPSVFRFLELAEVLGQMNPLFEYSLLHANISPTAALDQYVATIAANGATASLGNQNGPRTPANFPMGASPATQHLTLPDGSPHMGSPAQGANMQLNPSQQGTVSSGPSANTSPNQSNKRRRPSTVKEEEGLANGVNAKPSVKPSPRIGGKRQKGNPA